jgi:hypothetical protein
MVAHDDGWLFFLCHGQQEQRHQKCDDVEKRVMHDSLHP